MKFSTVIIILGCILCLCSCGRDSESEARLHAIDALCDSIPQAAIDTLAAIDPSALSEKDIYRYRLLQIKSRDKACNIFDQNPGDQGTRRSPWNGGFQPPPRAAQGNFYDQRARESELLGKF